MQGTKRLIKITCVIGTRPEVIKMAPLIKALRQDSHFEVTVICTAQHRSLLDDMLDIFEIKPDIDLNVMKEGQTLTGLTSELFKKFEPIMTGKACDVLVAQGDTTTTLVAALVAFYHKIPFAHVEAGLRSFDYQQPFPEEMNRVLTSKIATWHFAPTMVESEILLKEGVPQDNIYVTGNTVIDALYELEKRNTPLSFPFDKNKKNILITLHRRESFGEPLKNILDAFLIVAKNHPDVDIYYPVHPNPNVHDLAHQVLGEQPNIHLLKPMRYDEFVTLMKQSYFMLTDSGGIQEEAPALGKPVLVLREKTERPLVVELGLAKLVGANKKLIVDAVEELLTNEAMYHHMAKGISPYGDGHAAEKMVAAIKDRFLK